MTAVNWLIEELKKVHHPTEAMIMYAKKLEKQQIIDAYQSGDGDAYNLEQTEIFAKQYYNETYGSKGSDDHIVDTNEMVSSQTEISDEIFGQELFNYFTNQHNISLLQSEMHDIIDIVKKMEQTEISDAGKDTADYIDRHIIESMKELAREGFKPQVSEIKQHLLRHL